MSFSENKITEKTLTSQTDGLICQGKLFDLQPVENKRVEFSFTASEISSDGGFADDFIYVLRTCKNVDKAEY